MFQAYPEAAREKDLPRLVKAAIASNQTQLAEFGQAMPDIRGQ